MAKKFRARPRMHNVGRHFFRHSAVLSLPVVLLRKVSGISFSRLVHLSSQLKGVHRRGSPGSGGQYFVHYSSGDTNTGFHFFFFIAGVVQGVGVSILSTTRPETLILVSIFFFFFFFLFSVFFFLQFQQHLLSYAFVCHGK